MRNNNRVTRLDEDENATNCYFLPAFFCKWKYPRQCTLIASFLVMLLLSVILCGILTWTLEPAYWTDPNAKSVVTELHELSDGNYAERSTTPSDDLDFVEMQALQQKRYGYKVLKRTKRVAQTPTELLLRRRRETRMELNRLQRQYKRCKKEAPGSGGCRKSFARMYEIAKEFAQQMEEMRELLEDQGGEGSMSASNETEAEQTAEIEEKTAEEDRGRRRWRPKEPATTTVKPPQIFDTSSIDDMRRYFRTCNIAPYVDDGTTDCVLVKNDEPYLMTSTRYTPTFIPARLFPLRSTDDLLHFFPKCDLKADNYSMQTRDCLDMVDGKTFIVAVSRPEAEQQWPQKPTQYRTLSHTNKSAAAAAAGAIKPWIYDTADAADMFRYFGPCDTFAYGVGRKDCVDIVDKVVYVLAIPRKKGPGQPTEQSGLRFPVGSTKDLLDYYPECDFKAPDYGKFDCVERTDSNVYMLHFPTAEELKPRPRTDAREMHYHGYIPGAAFKTPIKPRRKYDLSKVTDLFLYFDPCDYVLGYNKRLLPGKPVGDCIDVYKDKPTYIWPNTRREPVYQKSYRFPISSTEDLLKFYPACDVTDVEYGSRDCLEITANKTYIVAFNKRDKRGPCSSDTSNHAIKPRRIYSTADMRDMFDYFETCGFIESSGRNRSAYDCIDLINKTLYLFTYTRTKPDYKPGRQFPILSTTDLLQYYPYCNVSSAYGTEDCVEIIDHITYILAFRRHNYNARKEFADSRANDDEEDDIQCPIDDDCSDNDSAEDSSGDYGNETGTGRQQSSTMHDSLKARSEQKPTALQTTTVTYITAQEQDEAEDEHEIQTQANPNEMQTQPIKHKHIKYSWIIDGDDSINSNSVSNEDEQDDEVDSSEERSTTPMPTLTTATMQRLSTTITPAFLEANGQQSVEEVRMRERIQQLREHAAGLYKADDSLLETLDATDIRNAEPQFNPMGGRGASVDEKLLTICERVALRLQQNEQQQSVGMNNSESNPLGEAYQARHTSERAAAAPQKIIEESMKVSMQTMPFGYPQMPQMPQMLQSPAIYPQQLSVPLCFMLSLANVGQPVYRPLNMAPMQMPGYMGSPAPTWQNYQPMAMAMPMPMPMPMHMPFGLSSSSSSSGRSMPTFESGAKKQAAAAASVPTTQPYFCSYSKQADDNGWRSRQSASGSIIYASFASGAAQPPVADKARTALCSALGKLSCAGAHGECIETRRWCDGTVDCSDSSDESACSCHDRLPPQRICDGYADCPYGEDELGCYGCEQHMYSCYANPQEYALHNRSTFSMCHNKLQRCDGTPNCFNGRDELDCSILLKDDQVVVLHGSNSGSEGTLYHNYRGDWYPVCEGGETWAQQACQSEDLTDGKPQISFRELATATPFIEPSAIGTVRFKQSGCQRRYHNGRLVDHAMYVRCPLPACGIRSKSQSRRAAFSNRSSNTTNGAVSSKARIDLSGERIVGGTYVGETQWPFVVALYRNGHFHCGGSIYSDYLILTAAHCMLNYVEYYFEVHAGLLRRSSHSAATQVVPVTHVLMHEAYDRGTMRNDVALLRLSLPLRFNRRVKPICMPAPGRTALGSNWLFGPEPQTLCTTVGWGAVRERGPNSDSLRQVVIPIRQSCPDRVDREAGSICAGDGEGGRDACQGDSGGPLLCRSVSNPVEWYLAGIVSHGNGCARRREFGVYTRVALYLNWIDAAVLKKRWLQTPQPVLKCPGPTCVWGRARCLPQRKRCDHIVDCLGAEDEVDCNHNFISDIVGRQANSSAELESDTTTELIESATTTESSIFGKLIGRIKDVFKPNDEQRDAQGVATTEIVSHATTELIEPSTAAQVAESTPDKPITKPHKKLHRIKSKGKSYTKKPVRPTKPVKKLPQQNTTAIRSFTDAFTSPGKFICRRITQFIKLEFYCDKHVDCEDGTDELNCSCRSYLRADELKPLLCDGKLDCPDGADETDCDNCSLTDFYCSKSSSCVALQQRCDGQAQCRFKEDEQNCETLTNGRELHVNVYGQPAFSHAGFITRNAHGHWHLVCHQEQPDFGSQQANELCTRLGFKGYAYYNVSELPLDSSNELSPPFAPELSARKSFWRSPLKPSSSKPRPLMRLDAQLRRQTVLPIYKADAQCQAIYLECQLLSNQSLPTMTVSAGIKIQQLSAGSDEPVIEPNRKPNALLNPPAIAHSFTRQDELLAQWQKLTHTAYKTRALLANGALYTAIEQPHWPWLATVYVNGRLRCLGVLINIRFVLVHDACVEDIDLNKVYMAVLLGGVKSKHITHYDHNEQILRVICHTKPNDINGVLLHLVESVKVNAHVLPMAPISLDNYDRLTPPECFAILQEAQNGRVKQLAAMERPNGVHCQHGYLRRCFQFASTRPKSSPSDWYNTSIAELSSEELELFTDVVPLPTPTLLSSYTNCNKFGRNATAVDGNVEPNDQGLLVCRQNSTGWFPMAVFEYTNPDCLIFNQPLAIDTLEDFADRFDQNAWSKCNAGKYECGGHQCSLGKCLADWQICNGHSDCHDGSDETEALCEKYKCKPDEVRCDREQKCIPKRKFCDHVADCEDRSDEPLACSCLTYLEFADKRKVCDGIVNCLNGQDESPAFCNCSSSLFRCGTTNECIAKELICNKKPDCPNGEDEEHCYALEYPQVHLASNLGINRRYGQVLVQEHGIWSTKCFPKSNPPDMEDLRPICGHLGYNRARLPRFRLIDNQQKTAVKTVQLIYGTASNLFGSENVTDRYREPTKALIVNKFSPLRLNSNLTLFVKSSRPVARAAKWSAEDLRDCYTLELYCL